MGVAVSGGATGRCACGTRPREPRTPAAAKPPRRRGAGGGGHRRRAWSPAGDGAVRLWDLAAKIQRGAPLTGDADAVWAVALSADGQLAVSGGLDGTVRLWDLAAGTERGAPLTGHDDAVLAVALSADGQLAVSGGRDGTVRVWDLAAAHCLLQTVNDAAITSMAIAETALPAIQLVDARRSGALTSWNAEISNRNPTCLVTRSVGSRFRAIRA